MLYRRMLGVMDSIEEKADIFVAQLLKEGAQVPCDSSTETFKNNENLPDYYDEELFKKGQQFYHKNIFAMFGGKFCGLVSVLAIPSILKILIYTKMSGSTMTAYRRYLATIFHMTIWYDSDFKPGSKLWRSIAEVKNLHDSASKKGCKAGLKGISQKDMALTQFGFMGYQLVRSKLLGIHDASEQEWKSFIHLWRVIGHLLGIEERFNICRESVEETKQICEKLLQNVFLPHIKQKDPDFMQMSRYLVDGMWSFMPVLNFNVTICSLNFLITRNLSDEFQKLTWWETCLLLFSKFIFYSLQWAPFRWYHNHTRYRDLWLMKNFPFLAYYRFGFKNSHVKILGKYE